MKRPFKAWVGYHEGCSVPLRVFESKELAQIWKDGAEDNYGSGSEIIELPVISIAALNPTHTDSKS
jgi:hypothetical protein